MTINILESINKVISDNLPESVGRELQAELNRLYEVEEMLKKTTIALDSATNRLEDFEKDFASLTREHDQLCDRTSNLEQREKDLLFAQTKLNEAILQAKLDEARNSCNNLQMLVQTIFKSPSGKRMVMETQTPYTDSTGRYITPPTKTLTETYSEEPSL